MFCVISGKKILKRIVMPFLLGLKFKATTVAPLAFALIALKTWKAFTFALLSLVLSAAMVIYKFTNKPKVSYELIHYPQPVAVYPDRSRHTTEVCVSLQLQLLFSAYLSSLFHKRFHYDGPTLRTITISYLPLSSS